MGEELERYGSERVSAMVSEQVLVEWLLQSCSWAWSWEGQAWAALVEVLEGSFDGEEAHAWVVPTFAFVWALVDVAASKR